VERRSALITLAGAVAGLVSLPSWASGWSAETVRLNRSLLSVDQNELLADIAETVIPATDTPGAKALNVQQFIQKVIVDCADKPSQEMFTKGIGMIDDLAQKSFGKPFREGDAAQRMAVLTQMSKSDDPAQKGFYNLVKNLTIRGYMNSEYVMTNLTHFEFIPGRYHGCVPVKTKTTSQGK
jgi:Gluconate 2-dehydrogenase subunit 3